MSRSILVTGATGKQGGAVLRALLAHPKFSPTTHSIAAVTRDPNSASAQKLKSLSPAISLVQGDLANASGIFSNLSSKPWGVYVLTNLGEQETVQGNALIDEAVKAGSSYIVLSSVDRGSANDGYVESEVPHFLTKHKIEEHLREVAAKRAGELNYTILRPPFFMDNLDWGFIGKVVGTMWKDKVAKDKKLALIDTKDIGAFAAAAFMEPDSPVYKDKSLNIAGDNLTFEEANKIFTERAGKPIPTTFGVFATLLLLLNKDMRAMAKFWNDEGFGAKPEESRALHSMKDLAAWVDSSSHAKKSN